MYHDEGQFGRKAFRADKQNNRTRKKPRNNRWHAADKEFRCAHCKQMVFLTSAMGTVHRNHCPHCLHSLHVDTKPGNRASTCHARMEPVALTRKHNGYDKYGNERKGDIMLVHCCVGCGAVNINRIAADDCCDTILKVFNRSLGMAARDRDQILSAGVVPLQAGDAEELNIALFGLNRS